MADCPSYQCAEWEQYDYSGCDTYLAGTRHVLLLDCGHSVTEPNNATQVQNAIDNGEARLIKDVLMAIPDPSPVTVSSRVAGVPDITITYDRTITLVDRKVSPENVTFYNSINASSGKTLGGAILYENETDRVTFVDAAITATGGRNNPEGDDLQVFNFTLAYRAKGDAPIYDAPTGIFS